MVTVTRVVLDTNVLVAAAYNPASASRRIVEACLDGELTPVLSPTLRHEYEFILARAARGRPYLERIHRLVDGAEIVEPAQTPGWWRTTRKMTSWCRRRWQPGPSWSPMTPTCWPSPATKD